MRFLLVLVFTFSFLFAAEMIVKKPIEEVPGDLALVQEPVHDLSGQLCALVKLNTDLAPFDKIESNQTPVKVLNKTGQVWIYLSAGDRRLYFTKAGYAKLVYDIPLNITGNHVYEMTLLGTGTTMRLDNVVTLTFQFNVEGVVIQRDGKAPITANSVVAPFRLPHGKYAFTFDKHGYQSQRKEVDLTTDTMLEISLQPGTNTAKYSPPGIITIESEPTGADVELNGQRVGTTPYQGTHFPGEYTMTLRYDLHQPFAKAFSLKSGETLDLPDNKLVPKYGFYAVNSTPSGSRILLDGKDVGTTPLPKTKIASGTHTLKAEKEKYKPYEETFTIKDGDDKPFNLTLAPNFARLEVSSTPEQGAKVFIDNREVGVTPYINNECVAGTYDIRIEKEFWGGSSQSVTVTPNVPVSRILPMTKDFGILKITARESQIYIGDRLEGTEYVEKTVKPGSCKVKATRDKHTDDEQDIFVNTGETREITLNPIPRTGSISVFTVDKDDPGKKISGAEVEIDGKDTGKTTPAVIEMLYGRYSMTLRHDLYLPVTEPIEVKDGMSSEITVHMQTYEGSLESKKAFWARNKWIALGASVACFGAGYYFNMQGQSAGDDYTTATTTNDAMNNWDSADKNFKNRDICYAVAGAAAGYTLFSLIMQATR